MNREKLYAKGYINCRDMITSGKILSEEDSISEHPAYLQGQIEALKANVRKLQKHERNKK